ncbi:MAG: HPF/RaiA family ribosome-associated protein [Candidatus Yanofskybacteria bacterium]|nr:HPF/RaiA family ribosome-associated protein [Candidatus Yanofskybacteria bacterium]
MKLDIFAKNIELDNPLRTFIEEKMGDIELEISKPSQHHRKGPFYYAEANMNMEGKLLRAEAKHVDLRAAIVEVKDELKIQLGKLKEKAKAKRSGRLA